MYFMQHLEILSNGIGPDRQPRQKIFDAGDGALRR